MIWFRMHLHAITADWYHLVRKE